MKLAKKRSCHHPSPGQRYALPDDRLLRVIQYSRDAAIEPMGRGVLDAPLAAFAKAPARP
jgi:hypothetical protein